ncbi:prolactin-releasing peptide receptor-like isoform X2 [Prorops nasuta]|uniref:prolactin-releasing peptide receptor-like isoform X2 n=1 Tax=Prorops nasuta TaxID=863751 RepID=UPI0034CE46D3
MIDAMDVKRKMHAWSANETWDQLERSNSTTDDATRDTLVQITFCVLYTSIFILGVFGNVLVCYVVSRKKEMQTVTNLFIANLAVSDILLCVLAVPFTPLYTFLGRWAFGRLMCHLMPYAQAVSVYISSLTLSSIAVDRFLVIIYPIRARMTVNTCFAVIVAVWIVALLLTLPFGIYIQFQEKNNANFCEENWPTEDFRRVFGAVTSTMQFIVPFLVVTFCYVRVWIRLNDRERCRPGSKSDKQEELDRKRKRRTNWMIISMVGVFVISWLPLNIVNIVSDFSESANNWPYFNLCFFVTHCLAMSSTCYNPFIYAWLNENFRKEFKQILMNN